MWLAFSGYFMHFIVCLSVSDRFLADLSRCIVHCLMISALGLCAGETGFETSIRPTWVAVYLTMCVCCSSLTCLCQLGLLGMCYCVDATVQSISFTLPWGQWVCGTGYVLNFNEPLWQQLRSLGLCLSPMTKKIYLELIWCLAESNSRQIYSTILSEFTQAPRADFMLALQDGKHKKGAKLYTCLIVHHAFQRWQ